MTNKEDGFRKDKKQEAIDKLRASLSKEELQRIKETRELNYLTKGSISYKLAVQQDTLKMELRQNKLQITKMIWNVRDIANQLFRLKIQLDYGSITEKLNGTDTTMTKDELKTMIEHMTWVQTGEVVAIPSFLLKIRGLVDHFDIEKKKIISEVQFDQYVKDVETELKTLGFELFEQY